jgi:hypothetical protein
LLAKQGKEAQIRKPVNSVLSVIDKTNDKPSNPEPHNTRNTIATELGWSTGKVAQADKVFKSAPEPVKAAVLNGELTINKAYADTVREEKRAEYE